jgi:hypothetical protein
LFVDGDDSANNVHVSVKGDRVYVRDTTGMVPGRGCRRAGGDLNALCSIPPYRVIVRTSGGDDVVRIYSPLRDRRAVEVWSGVGNDSLKAEPGPARVFLLGQADDDRLFGSAGGGEALWGGPGDDFIAPGGGADHVDGGHGDFLGPRPRFRRYARDDKECASRTHGFLDRELENDADNEAATWIGPYYREGRDTLYLGDLSMGALADLNVCRLGYFGTGALALVHAIENVEGTRYNDRLVGDDDANKLVGGPGQDWLDGRYGLDTIEAKDNEVDTVICRSGQDEYVDWREGYMNDPDTSIDRLISEYREPVALGTC